MITERRGEKDVIYIHHSHFTRVYSLKHERTFAGGDALGPRVIFIVSAVHEPTSTPSATSSDALSVVGALVARGWRRRCITCFCGCVLVGI